MNRDMLRFHVTEEVLSKGLTGAYLVHGPLRNTDTSAEFERLRSEVLRGIRHNLTLEKIDNDPTLKGFRTLHEAFGVSNRKNVSAPENLLRFLLKTGDMPRVNLAVDIYNLVSLQTGMALGAHDISGIVGDIQLRLTSGTEGFWPIGAPEPKNVAAGEYAYIDTGDNEVICRLEVRQVEKTKVTVDTTDSFYIVQGNAFTTTAAVKAATDLLLEWTCKFCGGEGRLLYAPW